MWLWSSYLFCFQRGNINAKDIHVTFVLTSLAFSDLTRCGFFNLFIFLLCMNTFIETYLQLRFNLICTAPPLLVPCTVGSVSHPSRCHCFDFSEGRCRATVPGAECSVDPENFLQAALRDALGGSEGRAATSGHRHSAGAARRCMTR